MYCVCVCFFFFFSSRRRHTRCSRDWSSDVCSSDLFQSLHRILLNGIFHRHITRHLFHPLLIRMTCDSGQAYPPALQMNEKQDRKSTRLNSSHGYISYAVFCLKKKKENHTYTTGLQH